VCDTNSAFCCAANPACDADNCGVRQRYTGTDFPCQYKACTVAECCTENPSCAFDADACGAGKSPIGENKQCAGSVCDSTECCVDNAVCALTDCTDSYARNEAIDTPCTALVCEKNNAECCMVKEEGEPDALPPPVAPDGSVTVGNGTTNKDGTPVLRDGTPVLRDGTDAPQSAKSNGGGSLTFAILGGVALLLIALVFFVLKKRKKAQLRAATLNTGGGGGRSRLGRDGSVSVHHNTNRSRSASRSRAGGSVSVKNVSGMDDEEADAIINQIKAEKSARRLSRSRLAMSVKRSANARSRSKSRSRANINTAGQRDGVETSAATLT
jgi:hypothetical protein